MSLKFKTDDEELNKQAAHILKTVGDKGAVSTDDTYAILKTHGISRESFDQVSKGLNILNTLGETVVTNRLADAIKKAEDPTKAKDVLHFQLGANARYRVSGKSQQVYQNRFGTGDNETIMKYGQMEARFLLTSPANEGLKQKRQDFIKGVMDNL